MDFYLRCNSLKCRAQLKERAVVTTCSHIFCLQCASNLGLSHPTSVDRRCPACQTILVNPDDAVATILNPSEDYKTSVLSGLDPNTIMECAGRALLFWTYQTTQEVFYQEFLGKTLTEKYTNLNTQMDKVIHNANSEISALQARISGETSTQHRTRLGGGSGGGGSSTRPTTVSSTLPHDSVLLARFGADGGPNNPFLVGGPAARDRDRDGDLLSRADGGHLRHAGYPGEPPSVRPYFDSTGL